MADSPSSSAGGDSQQVKQIHFKFCRECSNLLYPKEDRATNQLMFTCRTCHVGEPATSYCVYQNKLHSQVGDTAGVTQDVGSDPTVCDPDLYTILCGDTPFIGQVQPNPIPKKDLSDELLDEMFIGKLPEDYPKIEDFITEDIFHEESVPIESAKLERLPRANKTCPSCSETEAVFFQSQQRSAETGMKLYYVCCACGNVYM